ncbi:unnamed protein product [Sphagnum balticum]
MSEWRMHYSMSTHGTDVLVCGGWHDDTELDTCELYTPADDKWNAFPLLPVALRSFAMLTLGQSGVFVFGGWNGTSQVNTVYAFVDTTRTWHACAPMPQALSAHAVVLLNDGTAMVCGGKNNAGRVQSACYSYNATADEWTSTSSMNTARYGHGMSVYGYRNGSLPQHSHMHPHLQTTVMCMAARMKIMNGSRPSSGAIFRTRTPHGTQTHHSCIRLMLILHRSICGIHKHGNFPFDRDSS